MQYNQKHNHYELLTPPSSPLFVFFPSSFQELKVAFARSRKVAKMQADAQLCLAISLSKCRWCDVCDDLSRCDDVTEFGFSGFTDANAAFQQALAVLQPEQPQQQSQQQILDLRCRILLERGTHVHHRLQNQQPNI